MKGGENVLIPALKVAIFKSPVVTRIALYKELSLHLAAAAADSRGDNLSETRCKLNFKLANSPAFQCRIDWSTGRELNPRILVLQTSALATSPPVLILLPRLVWLNYSPRKISFNAMKNPPRLFRGWGACVSTRTVATYRIPRPALARKSLWQQQRQELAGME